MKRKKPVLMLALTLVTPAPVVLMAAAPDSTDEEQIFKADQRKFATLAERFGVRTEDWLVAYFYNPKDVVYDTADKGLPGEFVVPDKSHTEAFREFLHEVDTNGDGRYTLRDDGFDPEYDAEDMARFDRNKDGILSANDIAPRPKPALQERIQRILESLPRARQRYVGWPKERHTPERGVEREVFELEKRIESSKQSDPSLAGALNKQLETAINKRTALLAPRLERGERLFTERCAGCHGEDGRGNGPASRFIGDDLAGRGKLAPPRDIAWGIFKFQRRDSGELPTDGDLFATIRRGLPGAAMPAWTELTDQQVWDLVDYIKHLTDEASLAHKLNEPVLPFLMARRNPPMTPVPDPPSASPALVQNGRYAFMLMQCYSCHGVSGRGDGDRGIQADSDGRMIQARNYQATRLLKGGSTPREIYRTIAHGIGSTPMPAYTDEALLITNDMPAEFRVAVRIGRGEEEQEEFFDEDDEDEEEEEDAQYEFHLVAGLSEAEVEQIKPFVLGQPSREDVEKMSDSERVHRAQQCRWALAYYVRSLMPKPNYERFGMESNRVPSGTNHPSNTKGTHP